MSATVHQQHFEPQRTAYLAKQLRALETVSRRMLGEHFSLQEEVWRCFDLHVEWVPESIFEQAYTLYDEGLPGSGSLAERLQHWKASLGIVNLITIVELIEEKQTSKWGLCPVSCPCLFENYG